MICSPNLEPALPCRSQDDEEQPEDFSRWGTKKTHREENDDQDSGEGPCC